jgi:hypothetical protein
MDTMIPPTNAPLLTDKPRSDYPLSGAKTGPAWRAAWDYLRETYADPDCFMASSAIAAYAVERVPEVSPDTVKNLLLSGYRMGILVKSTALVDSRNQTTYRISDEWLRKLV